ncbi:MAG: hypothetical protein FWE14_12610 [Lachnospiraceae bacterium]|nr:hypothetical protein [Lachnospiraceae bacterium]
MNKKKLIAIIMVAALVIIGIITAIVMFAFDRDGIAVNSGTFTSSGGTGFTFGIGARTGSRGGISNVSNNTWMASPRRANGNSRVDYTFAAAELEAMTVRSTNTEGRVRLTFTQGGTETTFDLTGEFHENVDMSSFYPGRIRLRLEFKDARNVDTVVSWR